MATVSYKTFTDRIRQQIWPFPDEPINLVAANNRILLAGMADMGRYIPCLHQNHTDVQKACATYVHCGLTVTGSPVGKIKKIYTIVSRTTEDGRDEWCDRVWYSQVDYNEILRWSNKLMLNWDPPANTDLPRLNMGFRFSSTETDVAFGRARTGLWALRRDKLYIAPWLQSNEKLVIEWDGVKKQWAEDDMIDEDKWTPEHEQCLVLYLKKEHERLYGTDKSLVTSLHEDYMIKRSELIADCDRLIRVEQDTEPQLIVRTPTSDEYEDDEVVTTPKTSWIYANIGDYGKPDNGTFEQQVADLVASWGPDHILANGDNIYPPSTSFLQTHAPFYGDYLDSNTAQNRFWTVPGNHDHVDPDGGIAAYLDYFSAFPGNGRYYDICLGPVHWFMCHSAIASGAPLGYEPDGIAFDSIQGQWLKTKLALSTAIWKIVIIHDAPYTDHAPDNPGFTVLRWPFADWGADLVISGDTHGYERFTVDGFPYIVNGAGGAVIDPAPANDPLLNGLRAVVAYNTYGACRATVSRTEFHWEFYSITGNLRDDFTLTK